MSNTLQHNIGHSTHYFPPFMACFAGLGSPPYHLYRVISFDKLHVIDLGVTRIFCDFTNTVLQHRSSQPLSRLSNSANTGLIQLPPCALLCLYHPFRANASDGQVCISVKLRREYVPFLRACLLGLLDVSPDDDDLVQTALALDVVNNFLCHPCLRLESPISKWQTYCFRLGVSLPSVFQVETRRTTFYSNLLGFLRLGLSEENEMAHE